jgi:hypothetical protein
MKGKSVLYALAVVVLMGTMAGVALADYDWAAGANKPDASVTAKPEQDMDQSAAGEIREPVETGAVPDRSESSSELFKMDTGEEPTVELGGQAYRPGIDLGP